MLAWLYLFLAIGAEVVGTLHLRDLANGFHLWTTLIVVVSYVASFLILIPALKTINVGVSYAIWSAVGTAAVAIFGAVLFHERLNAVGIVGIVVIVLGVIILTASGSTSH